MSAAALSPEFLALVPPGSLAALQRHGERKRSARQARIAERIAASPFKPYGVAVEGVLTKVEALGRIQRAALAKSRAREFLRMPWQIDVLREGLSQAEPADGLRIVREIAHRLISPNANGAALFFRYLRRFPEVREGAGPAPAAKDRRAVVIRGALERARVEGRAA